MQNFELTASDGAPVACYRWDADADSDLVLQIAHGMGEHAQRYDDVARQLAAAGITVYANDHRGHGETGRAHWGYMGGDGWNRTLADMYELNRYIAEQHPQARRILLGHSMGAMLSQQYITRHGTTIDGLVLSGSPGFKDPRGALITRLVARFESWRLGPAAASPVLQKLLFGSANKPFDGAAATGFEWLSRDPEQVQKYIDDEGCGFVISCASLVDMSRGTRTSSKPECCTSIPVELPVYVFSGTDDPVHSEKQDINRMLQVYYAHGMTNIEVKWYEQGRHEMFNETNADEVVTDLL
ncbi:MAG: alpha/beta hydrolase, partial [Pseudomonadota bacterium]